MGWLIYAFAVGAIIIGIAFPALRPERSIFQPKPNMNVARCIELHNEIVRLGWEGMGQAPEDFRPKTWFEHHGQAAQKARRKLSPDLIEFLQGTYEVPESNQQHGVQYFHYYATALLSPGDDMFALLDGLCKPTWVNQYEQHHGNLKDGGGLGRYVRLYYANNLASHPEGLIFDQEKNMAIMSMSIHDSDGLCNSGRIKWYPLEDILAAWLDMIRTGKVKAVGPDTEFRPWELAPYTDYQVNEAVEVFDKLVAAIEAAMPAQEPKERKVSDSLIDQKTLDAANIPAGFAYDFLTRARRPSFRFIAPGLSLQTPSTIADQPFFGVLESVREDHREWFDSPPFLLFRSSLMYNRPSPHPNIYPEDVFGYPFSLETYPAGLYFHEVDQGNNQHSDAVSLVLPYAIGGNGWARKGDGTLFGENVHDELANWKNQYDELYQTGRQPFIKSHPVRLVQVLKSWVAMVERGDWKVGADGVSSGINEWKKADTRSGWEKYFIPPEW